MIPLKTQLQNDTGPAHTAPCQSAAPSPPFDSLSGTYEEADRSELTLLRVHLTCKKSFLVDGLARGDSGHLRVTHHTLDEASPPPLILRYLRMRERPKIRSHRRFKG